MEIPMTILRQRMIEDLQMRNLSPHTQTAYIQQVSRFAHYFSKSPDQLGPEEIRAYQIYLTNERKLAPASIQIAVCALCFFYKVTLKRDWSFEDVLPRPKKPQKLPIVLSPEEVVHFLGCVESRKHRVILTTCYAAGLRISEAVSLKPAAIDSQRMLIRREHGNSQKDRYVRRPLAGGVNGGHSYPLPRVAAREQPFLRVCRLPVAAQNIQQLG